MIPKKIHYCWFGGKPMPENGQKCILSWRKWLPDYEIKEWNEDNFDIHINQYCHEAYDNKKWAFVSDVARLYALVTEGGIYMDTDVEVLRSFDDLLENDFFASRMPFARLVPGADIRFVLSSSRSPVTAA